MARIVVVAACCSVGALLTATCAGTEAGSSDSAALATVAAVVDGDTIDVRFGDRPERIRLIGIDTPETKKPDSPVECFGPEATAFLEGLLPVGTSVRVERDVVGRDDYGRLLGYVHLTDGTFVNLEIVRRGYARPLVIEPNDTFAVDIAAAARTAEADDLGLWAACPS